MSDPAGYPLQHRIEVEFVEADVEMAFTLVDLAQAEAGAGDRALAGHVIRNAENVVGDIEARLARLGASARMPFVLLVEELRREIEQAKQHTSGTDRMAI